MYAIDKGYYDKAGLDIQVTPITGSSSAMLPLLARGDIDLSVAAPAPATFNQVTQGFDIQLLMSGPQEKSGRMATVWLDVLKDKANEIKDLKDLKGHTIEAGVQGTPFEIAAVSAVQMAGLDPKKDVTITYRIKVNSDLLAIAQSKGADVISMIEPFATQTEQQGLTVRWKPIAEVAPWYQSAQMAVNNNTLQSKRAAVEKFVEVSVVAGREINASNGVWTDDFLKTAAKWAQVDPATVKAIGGAPYFDPNDVISMDSIQRAQQFLADEGAVKQPVDVKKLVNTDILDEALGKVGRAS